MAPVTFAKRAKNFGRLDYSRRGARRRIRDAGPEQQEQAVAAWLACHTVTRCPPGVAFGVSNADDGMYF